MERFLCVGHRNLAAIIGIGWSLACIWFFLSLTNFVFAREICFFERFLSILKAHVGVIILLPVFSEYRGLSSASLQVKEITEKWLSHAFEGIAFSLRIFLFNNTTVAITAKFILDMKSII